MNKWTSKKRGQSTIWEHPDLKHSVVDRNGYYMGPRVTFMGMPFKDVEAAKHFAESLMVEDTK